MNAAQNRRYWAKWNEVKNLLSDLGGFSAEDADEQRKMIQASAINGAEKSSRDLTQKELDKVYDAFDAYLVLIHGPSAPDAISQPCKRLIWRIERHGFDEPYLAQIAFDQFKVTDWRTLDEQRLTWFSYTCAARASGRKRASA